MTATPATLCDAFLEAVARGPERPLLEIGGRRLTYGEALEDVRRVAGSLVSRGVRPGDRVALCLPNRQSFVTTYLGILWAGTVAVPVNPAYRETELRHLLADSGARHAVTDAEGAVEIGRVRADVPLETLDVLPGEDAVAASSAPLEGPVPRSVDDLAALCYTSGTTGRSKGARLTHGAFVANARAVTSAWEWTPADRLLLTLPLFHMHGLGVGLHGTLVQGSSISLHRRFEPGAVLDELAAGAATLFFGVPTLYHRLIEAMKTRPERPRGVRLFVSGSAPLSKETHAAFEAATSAHILERYGMTETVMIAGNPLRGERKPGTVGLPFPGVSLRVVDGAVEVKGPSVIRGYWGREEGEPGVGSAPAFSDDGWFRTGDLGQLDADGYLVLTGRASDLVISGGFNVYPREVEELLETHPAVREAAVFGAPDPDLGERVVAAVVASGETADELRSFALSRLARFKVPREIRFVDALPRNALGKVQKHVLRAHGAEGSRRSPG